MKRKNNILISIAIIVLISILIFSTAPLHKEIISTRFIAGENMGFDLSFGNLNFGKIIPGYSASREITITNNYNSPTKTTIKSSGEISNYIIISENNFILRPKESINITFYCFPKKEIELREYAGEIIITTKRV